LTKSSREKNLGREKRESRRDEDCQSSNEWFVFPLLFINRHTSWTRHHSIHFGKDISCYPNTWTKSSGVLFIHAVLG
jgi:hypothetical protein